MKKKKILFKIVLIGDPGVGKTSLIQRYVKNEFKEKYLSTNLSDFFEKEIFLEDRILTLQIWDKSVQERLQESYSTMYRGTHCLIIVFNVTDSRSFENLDSWHQEFTITSGEIPVVVLGTKIDKEDLKRLNFEKIQNFCEKKGWTYYEASSKEGINVDQAFEQASKLALNNYVEPEIILSEDRNDKSCFK